MRGRIAILCGPGNNGGDGYRLAAKMAVYKIAGKLLWPQLIVIEALSAASADAKKAKAEFKKIKSGFLGMESETQILPVFKTADVIMDCVFGTGGRAELPTRVQSLLQDVQKYSHALRVAVDMPSGIDSESGRVAAKSFAADLTWTIGFPKTCFLKPAVAELLGEIKIIAASRFSEPKKSRFIALEPEDFAFHKRLRAGHKGLFGRCGIIAGSLDTPGAAYLTAEAAHRVGAGYSTLYWAKNSTAKKFKIDFEKASFLFRSSWDFLDLVKNSALIVGPGGIPKQRIGLEKFSGPVVFDADALTWFSGSNGLRCPARRSWILTPHPGEAGRILGISTREVLADRDEALAQMVKKTGAAVLLKGAPSYLKFPSEADVHYVNLCLNPVFSKAGSGDILAGITGGFLAQRPDDFRDCIFSSLIFQSAVGDVLRYQRASIASDQLTIFSQAFERLKAK